MAVNESFTLVEQSLQAGLVLFRRSLRTPVVYVHSFGCANLSFRLSTSTPIFTVYHPYRLLHRHGNHQDEVRSHPRSIEHHARWYVHLTPFGIHKLTTTVPFGNVIDAIFGTNNEARHFPHPDHMPPMGTGFPFPTGSGLGFPFPTASGAVPTASGGMHALPFNVPGHRHHMKSLAIDYQLAPTALPKRQESALPSFSLVDPALPVPTETEGFGSLIPTATDGPAFPFPTETANLPFPTGGFPVPTEAPEAPFPTGGFPGFPGGTGMPGLPTTLQTLTRGPQPTAAPSFPGEDGENGDEQGSGGLQEWLDWLEGLFGGGGKSEMSP
jgi:hypothetical protein